ncbi:radical SAM family heme chaperone HemW [Roseivivax sp. GX 12232]|uniref:radical SAM family heme chaperone HemW n=1 Tax=Roseivivax sp. GX 12232 TaxID=2900547 RepID=UPI001E37C727|nr:radical SAM family heme chaperone HemW [Roseivivax sp. GX 12232]MCE0506290.1 radical SAM family heme chaperone HemW [Roseivivax sp. GX 12232]
MAESWEDGGFGLYVHWPFCEAKCPYCDFNSHVTREIDTERWRRAYLAELDREAERTGGRALTSIFFGGGTPSLMEPGLVGEIIDRAAKHWSLGPEVEITLEANPRSVEAERFQGFARAGVNRVSMGLQALNDADLRRLGRLHSVEESLAAFEVARAAFPRVSFDLIYARQDQCLADWEAELTRALDLAADHLSLYQLTIERGTAFWERQSRGALPGLPDEDRAAELYEATQALCEARGLPAYEVSNHAKPGAESRHNLVYWRYGDYLGIGPGAHGRLTLDGARQATEAWRNPGAWLDAVERGDGTRVTQEVPPTEQAVEYLMLGMRVLDGIDMERLSAMDPQAAPEAARAHLREIGLLWEEHGRIGVTRDGRLLLNAVLTELLPDPA